MSDSEELEAELDNHHIGLHIPDHRSQVDGGSDDDTGTAVTGSPGKLQDKNSDKHGNNKKPSAADTKHAGKKLCRGCNKWLELVQFPANSVFCFKDKRAFDCIAKQCKNDEDKEFVSDVRKNPKKAKRMLANYHNATSLDSQGRKLKTSCWNLAQFKETIFAESAAEHINHGRMMTLDKYIKHAAKEEGLSASDAARNRNKWFNDDNILRDKKNGEDRVRVELGDDVDFVGRYGTKKSAEMIGKTVKNPKEVDLQKMTKQVVSDHDSLLDQSGFDIQKVAAHMVNHGGSAPSETSASAFSGKSFMVPNVRDLLDEGANEQEPETNVDGKPDGPDGDNSPKKKTGRFWQGDRALASAQCTARNQARCLRMRSFENILP